MAGERIPTAGTSVNGHREWFGGLPNRLVGAVKEVRGLWPTVATVLIASIVAIAYGRFRGWSLHHNSSSQETIAPDASTLISMFITLYALFLGGFAGLAGFVVKETSPRFLSWTIFAVELLIGATLVDLWRILDSMRDLYTSGIQGLSAYSVRDDIDGFTWFFFMNALVVAFAIVTACLRSRSPRLPHSASSSLAAGSAQGQQH